MDIPDRINYIDEVPKETDVVIIGGGIIGVFIARELSRYKIDILVIEKKSELGFGVSRGQTGIIHVIQSPFKSIKSKLCVEGNREYRKYVEMLDVGFKEFPLYLVAIGFKEAFILPIIWLILRKNGYRCHLVRGSSVRRRDPILSDDIKLAIKVDGYAAIDSLNMIYALAENASKNGVLFSIETVVTDIKVSDDDIKHVYTNKGIIKARVVINAAGLCSDEISSLMGRNDIEFILAKGANIVFDDPYHHKNFYAPLPLGKDPRTKGGGALLTWDGRIIWGPDFNVISDKEDISIEEANYVNLLRKFSRIFKRVPDNPIRIYSGIRPINKEKDDFIIDHLDRKGLIILAGIDSPGFTSAPVIAKKVVEIVIEYMGNVEEREGFIENRKGIPKVSTSDLEELEELIRKDKDYGRIVSKDPPVSLGMVKEAILRGGRTLEGLMFRTGLYMGLEQGMPFLDRVLELFSSIEKCSIDALTKEGYDSYLVYRVDRYGDANKM